MAKFLYSMQNVLDIKERLETQAKTEYAEMNNRLFIEEETMKRLGKRLDSYENLARSSASERLDIMEMRRCNEAIDIIKNQMTQQAVRIRIAQRNVDNAMKNDGEKSDVIVEHCGDIYFMTGDVEGALKYWKKALEMGSESKTLKQKIEKKKYIAE